MSNLIHCFHVCVVSFCHVITSWWWDGWVLEGRERFRYLVTFIMYVIICFLFLFNGATGRLNLMLVLHISFIWAASWQNQQNGMCTQRSSDQPGHPPTGSLIRVFAVRMKKAWVLSYPLSAQRRLFRLGGCQGWSESSLGAKSVYWFCHEAAHLFLWFLPWLRDVSFWVLSCFLFSRFYFSPL